MSEPPVEVFGAEVNARPRRTGREVFDLILAVAAIFISVVSLVVAVQNGRTEQNLLSASSWPFLRAIYSNQYGDEHSVAIGVSNAGVGPAKIRSFEVLYRGKPVSSGLDLLRRCCGLLPDKAGEAQLPHGLFYSQVDETVLRAGEDTPAVKVFRDKAAPGVSARFADALGEIGFRACYCSVLDECWAGDLKTIAPRRVRQCPAPEHPFAPGGP